MQNAIKNMKAIAFAQGAKEVAYPVKWNVEEENGVFSCTVSAACPEGFDPDQAIVLQPEISNTDADFTAIHNHSPYWCRPVFGNDLHQVPEKLVESLLICKDNTWQYYLPVCADTYKTAICATEQGFAFYMYTNYTGICDCKDQLAFVCAEGDDPFVLIRSCAQQAAKLLGNGLKMRQERKMPEVLEYLGWCSWDAMQIRVNHDQLLVKAKEFADNAVPIHFAILDDMWADVPDLKNIPADAEFLPMVRAMKKCKMRSFDGAPERFPEGMPAAVQALKNAGIPHIGIWFPTTGYWNGFEPDGEAKDFPELLAVSAMDRYIVDPQPEKAYKLYDKICSRIKSWGADFVKIDNQGFHSNFYNQYPIGKSASAVQTALDRVTAEHFDGAMINCMGMPSECMFNRPDSAVSRCSDDFMPESREWFAKNVLQSAYNGLLQGQYYINDWDMWWTDDAQSGKNSLCRAISGGPIYISDKIGRTKPEPLQPLIFADGRILRCDNSAMPAKDCLIVDPTTSGKVFKLQNRIGNAGVLAVFNMDAENRQVSGTICQEDTGITEDCICYEHFSGQCALLKAGEKLSVALENNDAFRLYTFVPVDTLTLLGRTDKFMGVRAITGINGNTVKLYEGGPVGFVCHKPVQVFAGNRELAVHKDGILCRVECQPEETELKFVF